MSPRKRLKRYRDEKQMSVAELAIRLGCSPQMIYALEGGWQRKTPGIILGERIEALTGIANAEWDRLVRGIKRHRPIRIGGRA